jgi:hypothetical protein
MRHMPNNIMVTPCYAPDYERCAQLVRSVNKYVHGISEHLLIVDKKDIHAFAHLVEGRTRMITKESLFSFDLRRFPMQKSYWLVGNTNVTRGWILQQVVKLAVAYQSQADAIIYADADVMFIDDFDAHSYWQGDALRLFETMRGPSMRTDRRYKNWYKSASDLMSLGSPDKNDGAYIAQLNAVRPDSVRQMCDKIEQVVDRDWQRELLARLDFSEFILYGSYVRSSDDLLNQHFITDVQRCDSSWFHDIKTEQDALEFIFESQRSKCAVHLQSKLGFSPDLLNGERFTLAG